MAKIKYDGVIEAVRYLPDGKISLVRTYERRGPAFSDRILLSRSELVEQLQSGKQYVVGERIKLMGGMFNVSAPVKLIKGSENALWVSTKESVSCDDLQEAPLF